MPRWTTVVLLAAAVMQSILAWLQSRKTGKSRRETVLPSALFAGAMSIIFVRELFGDTPRWFDVPVAILLWSILLWLFGLWAVRLSRHLKESWRLEDKANK